MYSEELESLIEIALADGELTEKERQILLKRAQSEGVDSDEFEMVLAARLTKMKSKPVSPTAITLGILRPFSIFAIQSLPGFVTSDGATPTA